MPPNLRKPQPNLSKSSEGGSFEAGQKPSESTNPLRGLNITAEREIGAVGGVKATGKLTVGVDQLIGQQGVNIELDATNRTAGFGAGIGSTKGKLGVNIGGKIGYDEEGNLSIRGAEAGVNIAGFGGSASIDENEGIRGSISVAGAKVELGISKEGKKTVSLCYGVPGGELCVILEPDEGLEIPPTPTPTPTPTPSPTPSPTPTPAPPSSGGAVESPGAFPPGSLPNSGGTGHCTVIVVRKYKEWGLYLGRTVSFKHSESNGIAIKDDRGNLRISGSFYYIRYWSEDKGEEPLPPPSDFFNHLPPWQRGTLVDSFSYGGFYGASGAEGQVYKDINTFNQAYITDSRRIIALSYEVVYSDCALSRTPPPPLPPPPTSSPTNKIQLPNYPQHFKPMNCCDKVDEIYKYLGIAKLKKNKFPVSNAFLVPGGSGNDNCLDYYAIMQALFRMLANGLIINPKSKPLGTEWQNVNATAWASGMYEMMAESMSDGNSTQRFEVAAIMQLTQMMATLAENGRKIEFVADAIGLEPLPVAEEVPVCFTIYEGHKGFGKKEPKKINISGLKTDNDVENVLGKMLNPSLIPITAWKFKPGQISIIEALRNG